MDSDFAKEISKKYCKRFGCIAIEQGFITPEQLKEALAEQVDDEVSNKPHRVLGIILFEKGWLTSEQIETVLIELFKLEKGLPEGS